MVGANGEARGQEVVAVGAGSYADGPPAIDAVREFVRRPMFFVDRGERAVPTNDWWTDLVFSRFGSSLWAQPIKVDAEAGGVAITLPLRWSGDGRDPVSEQPLRVGGIDFEAKDARVVDWGDWTVTFRLTESAERYVDVTIGRGMPTVWLEYRGVRPVVSWEGSARVQRSRGGVMVAQGDRFWGVYPTHDARSAERGEGLTIDLEAEDDEPSGVMIAAMRRPADFDLFKRASAWRPVGSRLDWSWQPGGSSVRTTWSLDLEPWSKVSDADGETFAVQGWLPHHLAQTETDFDADGPSYLSSRGQLRTATGRAFTIDFPFRGIVPAMPAPAALDPDTAFDRARFATFLDAATSKTDAAGDTYWGGKDVLRPARYALMAAALDAPQYAAIRDRLRALLADWLTYTPGESQRYFARYPDHGGLVGVRPSYGSEAFNDHHFHYGYFTLAGALMTWMDPSFAEDYGPMLTLVAKDYANWDRDDHRFPWLRTFDPWAGHSWAGGTSSPGGNNQESSSEAMLGWAGLHLLGLALDDADMAAAGAMGYAMESRAILEYWFDWRDTNWSANYDHEVVGMIWSGGQLYGTYFSGDPAWVHGIQWLPAGPWLDYLIEDPDLAPRQLAVLRRDRAAKEGSGTISAMGPSLGNVILGYMALAQPDAAIKEINALVAADDPVTTDHPDHGQHVFDAHAHRALRAVDRLPVADHPLSSSYTTTDGQAIVIEFVPAASADSQPAWRIDRSSGQATPMNEPFTR